VSLGRDDGTLMITAALYLREHARRPWVLLGPRAFPALPAVDAVIEVDLDGTTEAYRVVVVESGVAGTRPGAGASTSAGAVYAQWVRRAPEY
jgi:hypothetical protein